MSNLLYEQCRELTAKVAELEAQVSQLTAERDEARRLVRDAARVRPSMQLWHAGHRAVAKWDTAEPKWRADSVRLGVTEAEVEKDLEKR